MELKKESLCYSEGSLFDLGIKIEHKEFNLKSLWLIPFVDIMEFGVAEYRLDETCLISQSDQKS